MVQQDSARSYVQLHMTRCCIIQLHWFSWTSEHFYLINNRLSMFFVFRSLKTWVPVPRARTQLPLRALVLWETWIEPVAALRTAPVWQETLSFKLLLRMLATLLPPLLRGGQLQSAGICEYIQWLPSVLSWSSYRVNYVTQHREKPVKRRAPGNHVFHCYKLSRTSSTKEGLKRKGGLILSRLRGRHATCPDPHDFGPTFWCPGKAPSLISASTNPSSSRDTTSPFPPSFHFGDVRLWTSLTAPDLCTVFVFAQYIPIWKASWKNNASIIMYYS